MRWVTMKPPKMLTEASATATKPITLEKLTPAGPGGDQRADDDHARNGVGDAHQRRMQRRRHPPDDVVADEHRQHEDGEEEDERIVPRRRPVRMGQSPAAGAGAAANWGWTTAPSRVSSVALTISSAGSILSALSLSMMSAEERQQVAGVELRSHRPAMREGTLSVAEDGDAVRA